jgi:hypothetical protein
MKKLVRILVATAMVSAVVPVFAQTTTAQSQSAPVAATQPAAPATRDWNANHGLTKTRAQVYQELVHAQQDGQLDYLNRTVYAHQ